MQQLQERIKALALQTTCRRVLTGPVPFHFRLACTLLASKQSALIMVKLTAALVGQLCPGQALGDITRVNASDKGLTEVRR